MGTAAASAQVVDGDREAAQKLLTARQSFLLADIRSVTANDQAFADLGAALEGLCNEQLASADDKGKDIDRYWAKAAIQRVEYKDAWKDALAKHLAKGELEALQKRVADRQAEIVSAQVQLTTAMIATELRLREPQVVQLRPKVEIWLTKRKPSRSQKLAGDLMDEILGVPRVSDWLLGDQRAIIARMRTAKKPTVPEQGSPGDDMTLGRGRYPEDDFGLETLALAMYHGWDPGDLLVLQTAGSMLGRELRRGGHRPARFGDVALFKSLTDPQSIPMWNAVVEGFVESTDEEEQPDPGPLYAGQGDVLIDARTDLIMAYLAERVILLDAQRAGVRAAVVKFVAREHTARTRAFGALDADTIWRELRLVEGKDPRRGSTSRKRLCSALDEILDVHQQVELGL